MGTERDENYYNTKLPSKVIPDSWISLYSIVLGLVLPYTQEKIVELGCGPGAFARLLYGHGFFDYLGIDFSTKCLKIAESNIPPIDNFRFEKYNLVTDYEILKPSLKDHVVFISIEVLEHINDDFKVLDLIPKGAIVVLTGPNRNDESHVRWFETLSGFMNRYSPFIDYDFGGSMVVNKSGKMFFIIRGVKK